MAPTGFHQPIEHLKGIGSKRAQVLAKELQLFTYADLLYFFPYKYVDRTRYYKISELKGINTEVQTVGKIIHLKTVPQKRGSRLVAVFADETGQMELVWFQSVKWFREQLKINQPYVVFGKVNLYNGVLSMAHPEIELWEKHRAHFTPGFQPFYTASEKLLRSGLTNLIWRNAVMEVFRWIGNSIEETLSDFILTKYGFPSKAKALFTLHFPTDQESLHQAQRRIKFEELFFVQLQLIRKNLTRKQKLKGFVFEKIGPVFHQFYENHLPFTLTRAQKKVLREIRKDVGSGAQMNRLLQGDVGSGKTIIAFLTMLMAIDNGFQACLMAPTEILARQHHENLSALAQPLNIEIGILTGSSKISERKPLLEALSSGQLSMLIGTHALLEDPVQFHHLGLAIIDEQHRFGVAQRAKLWNKNERPPHILVMTATPIPRTLAMSLYGDLEVSVIDELPPGRKPVKTLHFYESKRLALIKFLKDEIAKGRQVYVVYPLIEESETLDYQNLQQGFELLIRDFPLPDYQVSVVHGRMKAETKQYEMQRFAEGKTHILVSTTVIEVGVNVPNASVMVIESAERFGLSQLHQLRGRVGRGAEQSYCILMTGHKLSNEARTRMETMVATTDGFEIAEADLKLRGPGDLLGKQQSGLMNFKLADLAKDQAALQVARNEAINLLNSDPQLEDKKNLPIRKAFVQYSKTKGIWGYIS